MDLPGCAGLVARRRLAASLALAAVLAAAPVRADLWYEHYARAEQALKAEDWTLAVTELNEALARKGDSGARVRSYGMRVIPYFPYLKLGAAYYHLGQLDAALQALETEERLGAVQDSPEHLAELSRYRKLARDAQEKLRAEEQRRVAGIVADSLRKAEELAAQDRLDDAVAALAPALAVAPEHPAAAGKLEELRERLTEREKRRHDAERAANLVAEGRRLLSSGSPGEAASRFRQALELDPASGAGPLLDEAQAQLRASLQADELRETVADALEAARRDEAAGRFTAALERLQTVFAADAQNAEALALQDRLLKAAEERSLAAEVDSLLAGAEAKLQAGRPEDALAGANRVLALKRGEPRALDLVRRAYAEISRGLLRPAPVNLPPALRFADFREERKDGSRLQIVRHADFRLSGVAIDDSPVEVAFYTGEGREASGELSSQKVGEVFVTEFSLAERLQAGETVYRLVATDPEGLRSTGEYAVLYEPPFYLAPSTWWTALGAFAVLAAGVWAVRLRRRRRLLRRRFNPYVAGAPLVDEKMFFGREELVERILQTIHNNSLLLHGERRIGKTSLQHHLKRRLGLLDDPDYVFYPVYVDLQGTPEERFFETLADEVFEELGPKLGGLERSPGEGAYGYRDLVGDLRRVIRTLRERDARRVRLVLLIDEIDELNDYDPRINQKLRSLFMKGFAESLVAVVSGVRIKKEWSREASPWYNFFEEIEVPPLDPKAAGALVTDPVRGVFRLEDGVAERLVEASGGKPYLIQKRCLALLTRAHERRRRTITMDDVEAVVGKVGG